MENDLDNHNLDNIDDNESSHKQEKELNDIVPEEFKLILADPEIPEAKKVEIIKAVRKVSIRKASSFSGPIPPPELLKGYNEVIQNGAERIISMAENQSKHRIQLEDYAIKEELSQSRLGQIFGFILGCCWAFIGNWIGNTWA